uniref:Reverse transcriptase domain-containing protein n=1 Tax=Tanacetum cinerariifolium TaxID=118510 RepID=A0A6L2LZT8_TANCI|nr:hypothetical protein [Tanacetum cinerariifolium]
MPKVLLIAWERFSEIKHAFTDKQYQPKEIQELMCKLLEDVRNINEVLSEFNNSLSWDHTLIDSSPKFDYLLERAHINSIPPGIEEAGFDLEEEICLVENLSYDNSSPRPLKELNVEIVDTIVESLSPSPIPVKDGDSRMEEIDLFLATDDLMPPDIESEDYDSEGDVNFLEELLREFISAVMNNIDELNEDECFDPGGGEIDVFTIVEDDDYFPFIFVIRIFLPYLIYPEVSPLLLSTGSEDTIFDPVIST